MEQVTCLILTDTSSLRTHPTVAGSGSAQEDNFPLSLAPLCPADTAAVSVCVCMSTQVVGGRGGKACERNNKSGTLHT